MSELFYSRDSSSCFYGSKNNAMKGNIQSVVFAYLKMHLFLKYTKKNNAPYEYNIEDSNLLHFTLYYAILFSPYVKFIN